MLQPLIACGETRVSAEVGQSSRWGRGARLTRRVREEYRVYFDRNATQNAAKRSGSAGMDRRSSPHRENWAAWVLPQAVKDSSRTRRDEPAPELPTGLFSRRQQPRAHDWDRVSLSSPAPSCCPCNHPLCLRVRVHRNQLDLWMLHGEYAEYLIRKSLADGFDFFEVEYSGLESIYACQYSFCLRSGNKLVFPVLGQSYRNNCFCESVVITGIVLVKNPFGCSCRVVIQPHPHRCSLGLPVSFRDPVFCIFESVRKVNPFGKDVEEIKHPG